VDEGLKKQGKCKQKCSYYLIEPENVYRRARVDPSVFSPLPSQPRRQPLHGLLLEMGKSARHKFDGGNDRGR